MNIQYIFNRLFNVTETIRTDWESGGPNTQPGFSRLMVPDFLD